MHQAITDMLDPYMCQTPADYKNALKEIIQQIVLLGLSRQGFFNRAAFYGGTALRIGHGLQRFSEALDFTLLSPDPDFLLGPYLKGIEEELLSYELHFSAHSAVKSGNTPIKSAFIKGNTLAVLLSISDTKIHTSGTHKNELLKIKLEVDTDPPNPSGNTETLFLTNPIPFSYRILTLESLFAGKLHAIVCRNYPSGRVKGRDFYDFIWYMKKRVTPDISYLEAKLRQSGVIEEYQVLTMDMIRDVITERIAAIDFTEARKDITPFIKDDFEVAVWSREFFMPLVQSLTDLY